MNIQEKNVVHVQFSKEKSNLQNFSQFWKKVIYLMKL